MDNIKKARKVLKNSSVAKILFGVTLLFVNPYYGAFLVLFGLYLFFQSFEDDDILVRNKVIYLIMSIVGICDVVGSLILFINYDNFNLPSKNENGPPKKYVKSMDSESKKIDILLKLGVLMVFLSGLIFATTSWAIITDVIKIVSLFLFGLLFIVVSLFSEKKLKLYRSSFLYWILGIAFFLFTIIAIIYFDIFATGISFIETKKIAYGIVLLSLAGFLIISHFKYPDKHLFLMGILSFIFSTYLLLNSFIPYEAVVVGILSFIILFVNIVNNSDNMNINKYCTVITYIILGLNFGYFLTVRASINPFAILLLGILQIVSVNYLVIKYNDEDTNILGVVLTYLLFGFSFGVNTFIYDNYPIIIMLIISLYTVLLNTKIIDCEEVVSKCNYIIYSFASLILTLKGYEHLSGIGITFTYLFINLIFSHNIVKSERLDFIKSFETAAIGLFIMSIVSIINMDNRGIIAVSIISIVLSLIYYLYLTYSKDDYMKKLYPISIAIVNIYLVLCNFSTVIWIYIVAVFTSLFLFITHYSETEEKNKIINMFITYFLLLCSIFFPFIIRNVFELNLIVISLFFIFILLLIIPVLKNKIITNTTLLFIAFPLINLAENGFESFIVEALFENIVGFYILFMILYLFVKDYETKTIFAILGLALMMYRIITISDILVFIYVGLVGLIYIVLGFRNEKLGKLFFAGVVVVLIDIVKSLWNVWSQIPSWLYLLIVGLSIISFVMYREIKKQNKKS